MWFNYSVNKYTNNKVIKQNKIELKNKINPEMTQGTKQKKQSCIKNVTNDIDEKMTIPMFLAVTSQWNSHKNKIEHKGKTKFHKSFE